MKRFTLVLAGIVIVAVAFLAYGVFGAKATVVDVLYGKGDFEGANYSAWTFVNLQNTTGLQDTSYRQSGSASAGTSVIGDGMDGNSYYSIPFTMPDGDSLNSAKLTGNFLKRTYASLYANKWIVAWEVYDSSNTTRISGGIIDSYNRDVAWEAFTQNVTYLKFREDYILRLSTRCVNPTGFAYRSYTNWDDVQVVIESNFDNTVPTTAISAPVAGSRVSGAVYLKATAADLGGSGLSKVEFEWANNDSFTGATVLTGAVYQAGEWTLPWDTTTLNGNFFVRSRAYDARGNNDYSSAVTFTVDNTPPTLSLSYFSDPALSRPLAVSGGLPSNGTSDIYVRLDSDEPLRNVANDNQITIDAPGTLNDVTMPANFTWTDSGWLYKWHIVQDTDGNTLAIKVKGTDLLGNVKSLAPPASGGTIKLDTNSPTFTLEYYSDAGLTQLLPEKAGLPVTRAGTVFVKLVPDEILRNRIGDNKLYIDAPGVVNDVDGSNFNWTGTAWRYTWNVSKGNSGTTASIRVKATDVLGNITTSAPSAGGKMVIDNIGPTLNVELYSDAGLSPAKKLPLLNGKSFASAGSVWIKLIASKELSDNPGDNTITINAPGTDNDVAGEKFSKAGSNYIYRWDIADSDDGKHSNDGDVLTFQLKATDYLGNVTQSAPEMEKQITILNKGPGIMVQYFTDAACTNPSPLTNDGRPVLRVGINYLKLVSDQPLSPLAAGHLVSVDAPTGNSNKNDVENQACTWIEEGQYWRYNYEVFPDGIDANGTAEISIKATNWFGLVTQGAPLQGSKVEIYTTSAPAKMTITGNKTYLANDNLASASVTVHLDNEQGTHAGCEGRPVDISANFGSVTPSIGITDSNGDVTFTFKTPVGGTANISATAQGFAHVKSVLKLLCGPPDSTPPSLTKAEAVGKQMVYLTFNEPLKSIEASTFTLKQGAESVSTWAYLVGNGKVVRLLLTDGTTLGTGNQFPNPLTYTVTVKNMLDLADNTTVSSSITFESYTPHGKYAPQQIKSGNSTRMCGQCHVAHGSIGPRLLNRTTITKVCFVCHGLLGISTYRVEGEFTSRFGNASTFSASLHKSLDSDYPGFDVLFCTDCHNPHGDRIPGEGNNVFPKLLKATVNGSVYNQGNDFCFACHGEVDRGFNGDPGYYAALGGNHNRLNAIHYNQELDPYLTGQGALSPISGTQITCVRCHEKHGSQFGKLLDNNGSNAEENQCYKCHGRDDSEKDKNYSMTAGTNVYNTFQNSLSTHRVGDEDRGRVECSSCHGPHSVGNAKHNEGLNYSALSDPFNTKKTFTSAEGTLSQFCLKCHGSSLPLATVDANTIVPYTISFVDQGFTTNGGGWNKAAPMSYLASGHYNNSSLRDSGNRDAYGNPKSDCTLCHDWHGSDYQWLVKLDEDQYGADGICLQCHNSNSLTKPGTIKSLNVKQDLAKTSAHPTIKDGFSDKHANTEDNFRQAQTGSNRHAQCYDCHDPHTVRGSSGQTDKLGNISGVKFNWGTTGWGGWNNPNPEAVPVFLDSDTNDVQAYLCFKCHSKYAYGLEAWEDGAGNSDLRAPHNNPSNNGAAFKQTDLARDFNPNNRSKHIVIPGFSDTATDINIASNYGSFTGSWSSGALKLSRNSVLKCTDCHASATGAQGPHGSTNAFVLVAPWIPEGESRTGLNGTGDHLCFKCHSFSTYGPGGTGSSQFRNIGNMHGGHGAQGCARCHGGLPHGWWRTNADGHGLPLTIQSDPAPYGTGSGLIELDTSKTEGGANPWGSHGNGYTCKKVDS